MTNRSDRFGTRRDRGSWDGPDDWDTDRNNLDRGERLRADDADMPYDRGDWQGQYQSQGGRGQYQGWQGRGDGRRWSGERWSGPQGGQGMYGNYSGAGPDWQGQSQRQGGRGQYQGPSGQYQYGGDRRASGRPDRGDWDNPADRDWREHQQGRWDDDGSAQVNDRGPLYGSHMGWGQDGRRYGYQEGGQQNVAGPHAGKGPKGYQRSDDRIREEVSDALSDNSQVDASNVEVAVQNGEVTLAGSVADRNQKRMAEDVVERVRGVQDVHNQLRVQRDYGMGSGASYAAPKAEPADTTQTAAPNTQTGAPHKS